MITATIDKNWRDNCFGELDYYCISGNQRWALYKHCI